MIILSDATSIFSDGRVVLKDLNLTINDGEFLYVTGKSGAGKSTFIKLLTREKSLTNGQIIVDDKNISTFNDKELALYRRNIGVVFQDFKLIEHMTVFDNIAYRLELIGMSRGEIKERVINILSMVGLENKLLNKPHELSGGEQQRVAIARACIVEPKILLADEPTANLNYGNAKKVIDLFKKINKLGTTVIIVTHNEEIRKYNPSTTLNVKNNTIVKMAKDEEY